MDLEDLYRRTVESWTDRVGAVDAAQWDAPTPCADWNVRALVNHVVGEDLWTEPLVRGSTIEEVGDRFDGDLLGPDPQRTALDAAGEAIGAVAQALPARARVHLSYGDEELDEYLMQLAADHLIHGWDLAVATEGDAELDPELVSEIGAWFAEREEMYRSAGIVGARADTSADDPQSLLIAASGRDPAWAPRTG